jgi:hypothetical protein
MQEADRAIVPKERKTRCTTCCCRQRRELSGAVPGKEFFDPGGRRRVRGRNADNLRDRCQLDDADQGVDAGRAVCSNKEMLLAPKAAGCERAFGGAVIELRAPGKRRGC